MSRTVLQRFVRMAMLLAVLLLPLGLFAQNVTLLLKNVTVQEAVTRLQSQGNYTIVVNSEAVDLQKRILNLSLNLYQNLILPVMVLEQAFCLPQASRRS